MSTQAHGVRAEKSGEDSLRLSGTLTVATVAQALEDSEDWPGAVRTIDLSGIERSDSAGVALLLEWWRRARHRGTELHYLNPPAQMRAIIDVSGLGEILPMGNT